MKKRYTVNADAWLYGKLHTKGSIIELNDKQAKYELLAGTISLEVVDEKPAKKAKDPVVPVEGE